MTLRGSWSAAKTMRIRSGKPVAKLERINMARQISLMIVGAGDRGQLYADLAAGDPRVRIAAVADPDEGRRTALGERHAVPPARRYSDWRDVLGQPRIADAAVIATLD